MTDSGKSVTIQVAEEKTTDVLVAGGGLAGCAAAIAAARKNCRVLLAEQSGILGGQAALGLVTPMSGCTSVSGKSFRGLVREIPEEILALSKQYCTDEKSEDYPTQISPHMTKYVLLKKCSEAGVDIWFHTVLLSAEKEGRQIRCVYLLTKSGIVQVNARAFIDATGDGDLTFLSGAPYVFGSEPGVYRELQNIGLDRMHFSKVTEADFESEGLIQPCSIFFLLGGVDFEKAREYSHKPYVFGDFGITKEKFLAWPYAGTPGFEIKSDELPLPQGRILLTQSSTPGVAVMNMTRVTGVDPCHAESLNEGEITAQKQVLAVLDFLKTFIPGFEHCYLIQSADTLGIRESRRLKGKYVLSGTEAVSCKTFPDAVARGSYVIDIHDPSGTRGAVGGPLDGDFYEIPYGCLVTDEVPNLLCCGRCISADHVAHASTRIQGTCIQTGEAAGSAAYVSIREGKQPAALDGRIVRRELGWL